MALSNNLVICLKDFPGIAELMQQRQPGDEVELSLKVVVVENLADRASFDIKSVEGKTAVDRGDAEVSPLAAAVVGVMSSAGKPSKKK